MKTRIIICLLLIVFVLVSCNNNNVNVSEEISRDDSIPAVSDTESSGAESSETESSETESSGAESSEPETGFMNKYEFDPIPSAETFAPGKLNVYKDPFPYGEEGPEFEVTEAMMKKCENDLHAFTLTLDEIYRSGLQLKDEEEGTYGIEQNNTYIIAGPGSEMLIYYTQPRNELNATEDDLLEQDIEFLDELFDFYKFDRTKLTVVSEKLITAESTAVTFVISETGRAPADLAAAAISRCVKISASNGMITAIKAISYELELEDSADALTYAEAKAKLLANEYCKDNYDLTEIPQLTESDIAGCTLVYKGVYDDERNWFAPGSDKYVPYYCFYVTADANGNMTKAYVCALK